MKETTQLKKPSTPEIAARPKLPRTLAIDIGGTGVKAEVLDADGKVIKDRVRLPTPRKATPKKLLKVIQQLAEDQGEFERVSAGFPGVIKDGVVYTAANLGGGWKGFDLEKEISKRLQRPARIANDADVQGMGSVSGSGLELVITLGTGFGSVLFINGIPIHLELGHHPFHKGKTYEQELGDRALQKKGRKRWNQHLVEAIGDLARTFNYDRLYIGGGNTKFIKGPLPANVSTIKNEKGMLGGIVLWREPRDASLRRGSHPQPVQAARRTPSRESSASDGGGSPQPPTVAAP